MRGTQATERLAHVFIPGPPVPTTGISGRGAASTQLLYLDMAVEDALKLILSGGMVTPPSLRAREAPPATSA